MRKLVFAIWVLSLNVYAIDEERVISTMIQSGFKADEVRAHYKDGCASGARVPMLICSSYAFTAADLELNDEYKRLLQKLTTKTAKEKLIQAQRAWVAFRDKTCDYESDGYSLGRDEAMVIESCRARVTQKRVKTITEYLACETPGCPGEW
jgi:uncharacterized protein YecT (DUF1311 family)